MPFLRSQMICFNFEIELTACYVEMESKNCLRVDNYAGATLGFRFAFLRFSVFFSVLHRAGLKRLPDPI
jgi:hypothetical protein